ncbi:MAG: hypothetical protein N0E54_13010 [Candidatus Thiodiazotropha taylori]|nr:hypothetical protein [Candidatus Thiodiazotropha endolucinida]MCW4229654.1 hypothetical protein [Candidatus Thiodiazotropha taylori]
MDNQTLIAISGIVSTLFAAVFTGFLTAWTSIRSKKLEASHTISISLIERRESLYTEFLDEVNSFVYRAFEPEDLKPTSVTPMMALETKVAMIANSATSQAASQLCSVAIEVHKSNEKTSLSDKFMRARDTFIKACKDELKLLYEKM